MSEAMLEKAARAAVTAEQDQWDLPAEEWDFETLERHGLIKIARAVLMAVLPELDRLDVDKAGAYLHSEGDFVRYDDLAAILAQEPGA